LDAPLEGAGQSSRKRKLSKVESSSQPEGSSIHVPILDSHPSMDWMEGDQDPPLAVDLTSSPSPSLKKKKSTTGAIMRSYTSRDSAPSNLPPMKSLAYLELPGLVIFGQDPMTRVDSVATTNEHVDSLWRLNLDLKSVRSGIGGFKFPFVYDTKLLNIASAEGVVDSCTVLLGRCMPW